MVTKEVTITGSFRVTVDETKFTPEFMAEFRESFFDFDTVEEHIEHLAQLFGRGVVSKSDKFIEGYGDPKDFGITFQVEYDGDAWDRVPVEVELRDLVPA